MWSDTGKYTGKGLISDLQLFIPHADDSWFFVKMMSDPETMAYNAPWFPPDGCIPEPESEWLELQKNWIEKSPERFYAYLRRTEYPACTTILRQPALRRITYTKLSDFVKLGKLMR